MNQQVAMQTTPRQFREPISRSRRWIKSKILGRKIFNFYIQNRLLTGQHSSIQHISQWWKGLITPAAGHVFRKNLIQSLNLAVLIQQRAKNTAATAPLVPCNQTNHA
jgi:hypothetical protein